MIEKIYPTKIPTRKGITLKNPFAFVITNAVVKNEIKATPTTFQSIDDESANPMD